jgi:hypothetical protein
MTIAKTYFQQVPIKVAKKIAEAQAPKKDNSTSSKRSAKFTKKGKRSNP